ncbi:catalyzes late reaction in the cephamycin biosynthetic pathway [Colletotrichum asianum]|uniref:Catalyzes late reaction in the cephamycin biosynthetic pathway n=1 Tax=Colletotrichum asianum TaxID=702518 RepID=A0A8H3W705_9PEZI|nr:catalyzes late reaction in the cephamycin biosynthetic pathway [Colletotrichum asianum]
MTAVVSNSTEYLLGQSLSSHDDDSHDIYTNFLYLDTSSPGFNDPITFPKDPKERWVSLPDHVSPAVVTDVGDNIRHYKLDCHGFQYVTHTTKCSKEIFLDEAEIKATNIRSTGASYVHFFDYAARGPLNRDDGDPNINRPVKSVHCDQSYEGAKRVVMSRLPDKAFAEEVVGNRRFQIMNIWRPLEPIYKNPFAVTDARSIPDSDLVALPIIAGNYNEESWAAEPNPAHRWYFKFAQKPDEVLMFKCFDSGKNKDVARRVLHPAFTDGAQEHMPPRESFEVRAVVVYGE